MSESKTSERRLAAVEKQRQALELRKAGVDYASIARQLGYGGPSGAFKAVDSAIQRVLQEPAAEVRQLELERLDKLLIGLWSAATKGDLHAVDRVLAIMERRARLLGLDAPLKIDVEHRIRQIATELGLDPDEAVKEAQAIIRAGHS